MPAVLPPYCLQAHVQQSSATKAMGAMLAQLSQLPSKQYSLWLNSQDIGMRPDGTQPGLVESIAHLLQQCCSALGVEEPFRLDSEAGDPVQKLLLWLLSAMQLQGQLQQQQRPPGTSNVQGRQQQEQSQQQQKQRQQQQKQQQHPAEALQQVLDVLLSALQYRQLLSVHE
jgi:hypothetical protein